MILESQPAPGDPGPRDVERELVRLSAGLGINVPQSIKDLRKKIGRLVSLVAGTTQTGCLACSTKTTWPTRLKAMET